jgi:hypothetical protein
LRALLDRSQELLNSKSLVDNWRGRMLAKRYDRLLNGITQQQIAANQRRGQDLSFAAQTRGQDLSYGAQTRGQDLSYGAQTRGQDFALAPHLPAMELQAEGLKALRAGDDATAQRIFTITQPRTGFAPQAPSVHFGPTGDMVIATPGGGVVVRTAQELQDEAAARKREAARQAATQAVK